MSYSWDFGDGDGASGFSPNHTYDEPGTYLAELTVTDDGGESGSDTVEVTVSSAPPDAAFSASCSYRACSFDGTGSSDSDGTIVSHAWDFGDGSGGTDAMADHTYADPGTYTVTLTVTDNHGETDDVSHDVTATNQAPQADAEGDCNFTICSFDGTGSSDSDGTIVAYVWDFGDGTIGNGATPEHVYAAAGTYDVSLTVTDNHGGTDVATTQVAATAPSAVHLHDLKPTPYDLEGDKWVARLLVKTRDANRVKTPGVEVTVVFGAGKERTCVTNAAGKCKVKIRVADTKPKVRVAVTAVDWVGGYDPSANRDTDGDGDGETTKIWRPF